MSEFGRFFAVAIAGLALDIALAWACATYLGLPLWFAAAAGFTAAAVVNYAMHEFWTFREREQRFSMRRLFLYLLSMVLTLGARVACVALLSAVFGEAHSILILLAGAAFSFFVNYLISKSLVFSRGTRFGGSVR